MKNLFITLALLYMSNGLLAQTNSENYIKTTTYRVRTTDGMTNTSSGTQLTSDDKIEIISYVDGLGRPIQEITEQLGGNKESVISPFIYDEFGRVTRTYLPYARNSPSLEYEISQDLLPNQTSFYEDKYPDEINAIRPNPFSEMIFDGSPMNRLIKQVAPGADWISDELDNDHSVKHIYDTNSTNEVINYSINYEDFLDPNLVYEGYYEVNQLRKVITKDENWSSNSTFLKDHTIEEFKDRQGRVVLKRTYEGGIPHDTYYVYNDHGLLGFVIPPLAADEVVENPTATPTINHSILDNLCYAYRYDSKNRLIEKKIPGKEKEYIVYDPQNRVALTQDSKLKSEYKWLFTKYDLKGRVAKTGIYTHGSPISQKAMQDLIDDENIIDPYNINFVNADGTYEISYGEYYTDNNFPRNNLETLVTYYYDHYYFNLEGGFSPHSGSGEYYLTSIESDNSTELMINITKRPGNLPTGTKVKVLGKNEFIRNVNYYDDYSRLAASFSNNNYLNIKTSVKTRFNLLGDPVKTETIQERDGSPILVMEDEFTYDHAGRLKSQTNRVNNESPELISLNYYDELGQLVKKKVGGTKAQNIGDSEGLQSVNYSYNIRGWLTAINDIYYQSNDLFSFKINYSRPEVYSSANGLFNGNISQTLWKTNNTSNKLRSYVYDYDSLNRIKNAISDDQRYNLEDVVYDKNGNIKALKRKSRYVEEVDWGWGPMEVVYYNYIDDLTYNYQPLTNQLISVNDNSTRPEGFNDRSSLNTEFTYDSNGNMLTDKNKGINSNMTYNHLNLPTAININNEENGDIQYVYDAMGNKIEKRVQINLPTGSSIKKTEYSGSFVYADDELDFISHPEGYIEQNANSYEYVYQYKDHLGNNRLSYSDLNGDGKVTGSTSPVFHDDLSNSEGWDSVGALYGGSAVIDNEHSISGNSVMIHKNSEGNTYAHSNEWIAINNSQPTSYIFSGWIYVESTGPSNYSWARLVFFMNEDSEPTYFTEVADTGKLYTKNEWVYVEKRVTVPANIDKLNLRVGVYNNFNLNTSCTAWFDNLSIRKINDAVSMEIIDENNYYPFGLKHKGYNTVVSSSNPALKKTYNGKEFQDELGLNWHDYSARNYDASLGRWMNLDPLAEKYPHFTPYHYVYNSPLIFIDPDGEEGIVVSGQPGDHGNKRHFLENGYAKAIAAQGKVQDSNEKVTWIVYNDGSESAGHSPAQLKEFRKKAEKAGINFKVVNKAKDIVNYINNKTGGDSRKKDKISSFYYVGHATPGDLDVGYAGSGEDFEPDDLNAEAFRSGAWVNCVGGCRTAIDGIFDDSVVDQFADLLDELSTVFGVDVKVQYDGGVQKDTQIIKENKGNIISKKGKRKKEEDE